mmetsp:Transcript_69516/g.194924  ORF Transcript_69516/g.194924 Transcript_69516/m.194924 type:complete len:188 (+) Transcript_69516:101-664(+)
MALCCAACHGAEQIVVGLDKWCVQDEEWVTEDEPDDFAIFGLPSQTTPCPPVVKHNDRREKEKTRLKALTEDFFSRAQRGMEVALVDEASGSPVACFLVLDTSFTRLSFYPADGSRHVLLLRDLAEPSRGKALSCGLSSPERCVAVGIVQEPRRFVCLFDDSEEADNFFTCITILRLALRVPIPGPV